MIVTTMNSVYAVLGGNVYKGKGGLTVVDPLAFVSVGRFDSLSADTTTGQIHLLYIDDSDKQIIRTTTVRKITP